MASVPFVHLKNAIHPTKCPQIGLGTWLAHPGEVEKAIKVAIDLGYRHFDTAHLYGNEKEIGTTIREKIADGTVKREDIFVSTKLWNTYHEKDLVVDYCRKSLERLGLGYIDLYLIHWPVAQKFTQELNIKLPFKDAIGSDYDYLDTWKGMEECVEKGYAKNIGISNFNKQQVERLMQNCKIKPTVNQVEIHPNLNQKGLIKFCKDRGIEIVAYSPLGSPARPWMKPGDAVLKLDNPKLLELSDKHRKTPAQIVLRYVIQLGCIPIPKSSNEKRLAENINVFDFELDNNDMALMDGFNIENGRGRAVAALELSKMPNYPFADEILDK